MSFALSVYQLLSSSYITIRLGEENTTMSAFTAVFQHLYQNTRYIYKKIDSGFVLLSNGVALLEKDG